MKNYHEMMDAVSVLLGEPLAETHGSCVTTALVEDVSCDQCEQQ